MSVLPERGRSPRWQFDSRPGSGMMPSHLRPLPVRISGSVDWGETCGRGDGPTAGKHERGRDELAPVAYALRRRSLAGVARVGGAAVTILNFEVKIRRRGVKPFIAAILRSRPCQSTDLPIVSPKGGPRMRQLLIGSSWARFRPTELSLRVNTKHPKDTGPNGPQTANGLQYLVRNSENGDDVSS